jgi:hypothetical protein
LPGRPLATTSFNPDRLLPGEPPASNDPEDAEHWISVYTELLETMHQVMVKPEVVGRQASDGAGAMRRADLRTLELQIENFEGRLAFWRSKLRVRS